MNGKHSTWSTFILGELAEIQSGQDIYKTKRVEGDVPYVTAGSRNNGIGDFVGNDNGSRSHHVISVNRNGAVGESFYHPYYALFGNDCRRVFLDGSPNRFIQLFMTCCISNQKSTFGYARKLGTSRLEEMRILLPADSSGKPDWAYMESSVREREGELLDRYLAFARQRLAECEFFMEGDFTLHVGNREWAAFRIDELFEIRPGKRLETRNKEPGDMPFIGASESNNGVTGFVSNINSSLDSDTLGVNYNGAPCVAFYHPYQCLFSDDVKHLHIIGHEDNQHVMLFLAAVFAKQRVKFSYGYKCNEQRMRKQSVMLPVDPEGQPDWDFMERFGRERERRLLSAYIAYIQGRISTMECQDRIYQTENG